MSRIVKEREPGEKYEPDRLVKAVPASQQRWYHNNPWLIGGAIVVAIVLIALLHYC